MLVGVALAPSLIQPSERAVCIVVDVLRASSACVTIFDRGAAMVAVAETPDVAHRLRRDVVPQALLCGEVGGLPPDGFDYGNSPAEFARLDLAGRDVVLATSNGTRALHAVAGSPAVYVGALLNRAAVSAAALAAAVRLGCGIAVICAGNDFGRTVSLDDVFTAGAIVKGLLNAADPAPAAVDIELTDAARLSQRLFASYGGKAAQVFRDGSHGRTLGRLGFAEDLEFCAQLDRSRAVPTLRERREGLLLLRQRGDDAPLG